MSVLTALIAGVADDLAAARDELNRLDGVAGDGDLGITVAAGCAALQALLPDLADEEPGPLLRRCGRELARTAPSTSGTLVATALMAAGRLSMEPDEALTAFVARSGSAAFDSISERGKASLGDRTMLDALGPAVAALHTGAASGTPIGQALLAAAAAAAAGVEATRTMEPKVGRAAWLAGRAAGNVDAGARLVALILHSAADRLSRT
jgi:dihydroxyacetone kinase-like protein